MKLGISWLLVILMASSYTGALESRIEYESQEASGAAMDIMMVGDALLLCEEPDAEVPNACMPVHLDGTGSEGENLTYSWWREDDPETRYNTSAQTFYLPVGNFTIHLVVDNGTANHSNQLSIRTHLPASTPPQVTLDDPVQGANVSGPIAIRGTLSDAELDMVFVELNVVDQFGNDKVVVEMGPFNSSTNPDWAFTWDTLRVPNGNYTISVRARDDAYGIGGGLRSDLITAQVQVNNSYSGYDDVIVEPVPKRSRWNLFTYGIITVAMAMVGGLIVAGVYVLRGIHLRSKHRPRSRDGLPELVRD